MILTGTIALCILAAIVAGALWLLVRLGLTFHQALLYLPLKLLYRIDDSGIRAARKADAPVVYVVCHQSRLDPALMLALLPDDTLHILDDASARSHWLEPWRELARTIAFNAEHVFVSRRLVRVLKGRGRLAVYLPDDVEPDTRTFRLYRAVARIALRADAKVVPVFIAGARNLPFSLTSRQKAPRRLLPRLDICALEPRTISELMARNVTQPARASNALFDRVAEARVAATDARLTLFLAARQAAFARGARRIAVEDAGGEALDYRRLLIRTRLLALKLAGVTAPGESVGVLLPNGSHLVLALLGLSSAGRVAAMLDPTASAASMTTAVRTALVRTIVSSRGHAEKANLGDLVDAAEKGGARFLWIEDMEARMSVTDRIAAASFWWWPVHAQDAAKPAAIMFTPGSEGAPKAVVLSARNLLANAAQVAARLSVDPSDKLLNVLPAHHAFGLTGGIVLPLLTGMRLFLYPSPLHYRIISEVADEIHPTVLVGTDAVLAGYAQNAQPGAFSSLRFALVAAEPVRPETRRDWRERFGVDIIEGYGLTEASPVVSLNTKTHGRDGTEGRPLPAMRIRLAPVNGVADGGRLQIEGPNLMLGYMDAENPGTFRPVGEGWFDTGDIASVDRDGFVTILDRASRFARIGDDLVALGAVEMLAERLWPQESHAAIAVADGPRGERIVLVTTAVDADREQLKRAGKLPKASPLLPDEITKVAKLPLLGSGRIDYAAVRRLVDDKAGNEVAA